eukprot:TRINITY_DN4427_c0_g1_i1.p1 TRINITY_DN4427_c0_g1~~TRINITY_DN4427_c0_g1_i1.p1  ORF type:complete len:346 (+),score=34.32 TRINITY_DN4427_c0_g1_i1:464-1501(+)
MRRKIRSLERGNSEFMRRLMGKLTIPSKSSHKTFDLPRIRTPQKSHFSLKTRKHSPGTPQQQPIMSFKGVIPEDIKEESVNSVLLDKDGGTHIIVQNTQTFSQTLNKHHMEYLHILTQDKDLFRVIARTIPDDELSTIMFLIKALMHDSKCLFKFIEKLVKLVKCLQHLNTFITADESIEYLVNVICPLTGCDRASVFLIDETTGELWSKKAKGAGTIRIPYGTGIVGAAIITGKIINIPDAYKDTRFNKNVDIQTNYRTKTILCVPLHDKKGKVVGACQAINKKKGVFSPDDEEILKIVADQAAAMLQYGSTFETSVLMQFQYKALLNVCFLLLINNIGGSHYF